MLNEIQQISQNILQYKYASKTNHFVEESINGKKGKTHQKRYEISG